MINNEPSCVGLTSYVNRGPCLSTPRYVVADTDYCCGLHLTITVRSWLESGAQSVTVTRAPSEPMINNHKEEA